MGDIWSTGAFSFESPLKDLLDSESYTVEQLLEQDELLQELRGMHPTLLQFFSQDESVVKLIQHVIHEKSPVDLALTNEDEAEAGTLPQLEPTSGQTNQEQDATQEDATHEQQQQNEEEDEWEVHKAPSPQYSQRDVQVLRYPYVACEVICSEINAIVDTVVDGQVSPIISHDDDNVQAFSPAESPTMILDLFFSVLFNTEKGQMDDYRAGYFDKILSVLCRKRPAALTTYLNEGGGKGRLVLMKAMMQHLYSQSILQVVQRLMMPHPSSFFPNDDEDAGKALTNGSGDDDDDDDDKAQPVFRSRWSETPEGVDMLLASLFKTGDDRDYERNLAEAQNASEVLITMIQNSPLISRVLLRLTQEPDLPKIMDAACNGDSVSPHDNRLTCAMNVLESLILQLGGYGSATTEFDGGQLPTAGAETLIQHLPIFLQRLKGHLCHESTQQWVSPMQFSTEPQPILGTSRLRIVRLIESLVLLGNIKVDELLCQSDILQVCLDLFWEFEWNSMLHQSVANLLVHVFEGQNSRAILQKYFLQDCNLLQRLVESFETEAEEGAPSPEPVDAGSNDGTDDTFEDHVLPVSDDDVDAALERREEGAPKDATKAMNVPLAMDDYDDDDVIERDPRDHSRSPGTSQSSARSLDLSVLKDMLYVGADAPSHIPSLRKGYMGHVIIVCQALVHACTTTASGGGNAEENGEYADKNEDDGGRSTQEQQPIPTDDPGERLVIADLIDNHPMHTKWQDFVTSTLASETAIQSTPLGGFHASAATIDPMHSHRPGSNIANFNDEDYDDDDDDDEIPGGDVIDMDDNDIEIAASMIDALSLPKTREFNPDAFSNISRGGGGNYMFDDPLGSGHRFDANFDDVVVDNEDEDHEADNRRASIDLDPPVMDLFAGNLAFDSMKSSGVNGEKGGVPPDTWSNFASFDDAFAAPIRDSFPLDNPDPAAEPSTKLDGVFYTEDTKRVDDIFGAPAPHEFLLDAPEMEEETPMVSPEEVEEEEEEQIPMTSQYPSSRRQNDSDDDSSVDETEPPPSMEDNDDEASPSEEVVAA